MYQIDNEKFGTFLSEMRKEKNLTQKALGEKLFVSDKTVSKWERGASIPNVTLLLPLAEVLGITVTELLKGERFTDDRTLKTDEVEHLVVNSLDLSVCNSIKQHKKSRIAAFLFSSLMILVEMLFLAASGIPVSSSAFKDLLLFEGMHPVSDCILRHFPYRRNHFVESNGKTSDTCADDAMVHNPLCSRKKIRMMILSCT